MFNSNNIFPLSLLQKSKPNIENDQFFKRKIIDLSVMMITQIFKDTAGKWTCLNTLCGACEAL